MISLQINLSSSFLKSLFEFILKPNHGLPSSFYNRIFMKWIESKNPHLHQRITMSYQFYSFLPQKRPKKWISRSGICHHKKQKCYRNPFFRHFNPPKNFKIQITIGAQIAFFVWLGLLKPCGSFNIKIQYSHSKSGRNKY